MEEIDAIDNGIEVAEGVLKYRITSTLSHRVGWLNPAWNEEGVEEDVRWREERGGVKEREGSGEGGKGEVRAGRGGMRVGREGVRAGREGVRAGREGVRAEREGVRAGRGGVRAGRDTVKVLWACLLRPSPVLHVLCVCVCVGTVPQSNGGSRRRVSHNRAKLPQGVATSQGHCEGGTEGQEGGECDYDLTPLPSAGENIA